MNKMNGGEKEGAEDSSALRYGETSVEEAAAAPQWVAIVNELEPALLGRTPAVKVPNRRSSQALENRSAHERANARRRRDKALFNILVDDIVEDVTDFFHPGGDGGDGGDGGGADGGGGDDGGDGGVGGAVLNG
ncbi:hypothetical protein Rs2_44989 [Raphanus sativus]|nr:hypothetical protein Rs2_44989 [Raphanus sativus]